MAAANRATPELLSLVENVIIKHRLRLTDDKIEVAQDLFEYTKSGS